MAPIALRFPVDCPRTLASTAGQNLPGSDRAQGKGQVQFHLMNTTTVDLYMLSFDGERTVGGSTLGRGFVDMADCRIWVSGPHPDLDLPQDGWESTLSEIREREIPGLCLRHHLTEHKLRKVSKFGVYTIHS